MKQPVYRILGIAPYEGMQTEMLRVAEAFPNVHLEVYIGDMGEGVAIFKEHQNENFDAVISRGGTAEMIREVSQIPVVAVQLSVYDILRAIKLAENYAKRYAIAGFPDITSAAHILCDLLRLNIDIVTIRGADEVDSTLSRLKENGYKMVIGDVITRTVAQQRDMDALLITSGLESFQDAFEQALAISNRFHFLQQENFFLKRIVREKGSNTVILSEDGELAYASQEEPDRTQLEFMRAHIREIPAVTPLKFYHNEHGVLYNVTASVLRMQQQKFFCFHYKMSHISLRPGKNGIHSFNENEAAQLFMNSFYSLSGAMGALEHDINAIALTRQPVMILGEPGTGKEQIARALYLRSPRVKSPFTVVDCANMNDKRKNFLFEHYGSPLNDSSGTVYFQYLDQLPGQYYQELLNVILEFDAPRRVRLIFSWAYEENQLLPEPLRAIIAQLGCLILRLPTLRSRVDEIPSLASLYLSSLNMELGKQIIGFEPQALSQLLQYEWPNNYTQFKQVLYELATLTDSAYIRRSTVMNALAGQRRVFRRIPSGTDPDTFKPQTLNEITRSAILRTMEALDGNQSAAARQLGISRTTLWRYLAADKKEDPDGFGSK